MITLAHNIGSKLVRNNYISFFFALVLSCSGCSYAVIEVSFDKLFGHSFSNCVSLVTHEDPGGPSCHLRPTRYQHG